MTKGTDVPIYASIKQDPDGCAWMDVAYRKTLSTGSNGIWIMFDVTTFDNRFNGIT